MVPQDHRPARRRHLVPAWGRAVATSSKNYRYFTNHQVVIDADTCLVVAVGRPLPGIRNGCQAREDSGAKARRRPPPR